MNCLAYSHETDHSGKIKIVVCIISWCFLEGLNEAILTKRRLGWDRATRILKGMANHPREKPNLCTFILAMHFSKDVRTLTDKGRKHIKCYKEQGGHNVTLDTWTLLKQWVDLFLAAACRLPLKHMIGDGVEVARVCLSNLSAALLTGKLKHRPRI